MKAKPHYHIYALRTTPHNIETAQKSRFSRITPWYILVYSTRKPVKEALEIKKKDQNRMSEADHQWLYACNLDLLSEEMKNKTPDILKDLSEKVALLEHNLKIEQEKVIGGGGFGLTNQFDK